MRCPSCYLKEQLRDPMNLNSSNRRTRGSVKVAFSEYAAAEKAASPWLATRLCSKSLLTTCHPPYRVRTVFLQGHPGSTHFALASSEAPVRLLYNIIALTWIVVCSSLRPRHFIEPNVCTSWPTTSSNTKRRTRASHPSER